MHLSTLPRSSILRIHLSPQVFPHSVFPTLINPALQVSHPAPHISYFERVTSTSTSAPAPAHKKKAPNLSQVLFCDRAEGEGFEPPEPRSSTVFKTAAIDHSAILPRDKSSTDFSFCQIKMQFIFKNLQFSPFFAVFNTFPQPNS